MNGLCLNCGVGVNSYFGSILIIFSGGLFNNVKCEVCGFSMIFDKDMCFIIFDDSFLEKKVFRLKKLVKFVFEKVFLLV